MFVGTLGLLSVSSEKALALFFAFFGIQIVGAIVGGILDHLTPRHSRA